MPLGSYLAAGLICIRTHVSTLKLWQQYVKINGKRVGTRCNTINPIGQFHWVNYQET